MKSNANAFLTEWTRLVNERNLEAVLALYSPGAVLVPTFSSRMMNSPERIRDYFEALCARERLGIELHEKPRIVTPLGDESCALSGIYRWQFEVDEELLQFEARYSFVLDFSRQGPVLHHHSSQVPRML